jgi:hypothetical protein
MNNVVAYKQKVITKKIIIFFIVMTFLYHYRRILKMNKLDRQKLLDEAISLVKTSNRYYNFAIKISNIKQSDSFKILFELIDVARTYTDIQEYRKLNLYFLVILIMDICKFNHRQQTLIYRRIFFNQEFLEFYLHQPIITNLKLVRINEIIGKDKMCMKALSKFILNHRKKIFELSDIVYAFKYNIEDNTVDCILNILLKHVDKNAINDGNMLRFINCDRKFTINQQKKIDAIKILCIINE